MRRLRLLLVLIISDVSLISSSLLMKSQAFALSGTGVGIRVEGAAQAYIGDTIEYVITVYNLGDYWIRNTTITDRFPNGTSSSWGMPDLAPLGQLGDSFNISSILYTIQYKDVFLGNPPYIINHAEATGYSDVQGLNTTVLAKTDYPTLVLSVPVPVGGYSISIKTTGTSTPTTIYTILLSILTAAFSISSACKQKAYPNRRTTPKGNS
jgi:uncharacterized repeat protein (TIGR01451 family)